MANFGNLEGWDHENLGNLLILMIFYDSHEFCCFQNIYKWLDF